MRTRTQTIRNEYDGPAPPRKGPGPAPGYGLDYAFSDDAAEIDRGIRETIRGIRASILSMGIGLAKIKARGLYADLRFHSMAQYIESLCEDMRMERSSLHNWLYIGEAWLKHRRDLERIGFSDGDGPTKLPYVDRAMSLHQKRDVFRAVKEMTLRQFVSFARGDAGEPGQPEPGADVRVRGNRVFFGERPAVTLDEGLDRRTRAYLEKVILETGRAMEAGEVVLPVRLYDLEELRRFERAAERLKRELRAKR